MKEKQEVIDFCLTLKDSYVDYPFQSSKWTVIRHKQNNKVFVWIIDKDGYIWVNVKCDTEWCHFWRNTFKSVVPGFSMNKNHWNSIILDGTVPEDDCKNMIIDSYNLTLDKKQAKS